MGCGGGEKEEEAEEEEEEEKRKYMYGIDPFGCFVGYNNFLWPRIDNEQLQCTYGAIMISYSKRPLSGFKPPYPLNPSPW